LDALGLGSRPETEQRGLISRVIGLATGREATPGTIDPDRPSLMLERPLAELPVVDNYRWNRTASEQPVLAALWWWLVLAVLGWAAWPLAFALFRPLRDRGYLLSRTLGWLLAGWLLWWLASAEWAINSVRNAWLALLVLALLSTVAALRQRQALRDFLRGQWPVLLVGEVLFAAAYGFFLWIRLHNPDLWQPWFGGEKFMEFAFLNGILRSPYFPPVDPHFAGGYINYYYFGLYLVAYLIKLTGIYAEVAFNLAIATLFALTVVNSFAVAYSAVTALHAPRPTSHVLPWRAGLMPALLAPFFVTLIGNLDGFAQLVRNLAQVGQSSVQSSFGIVQTLAAAINGLGHVLAGRQTMPGYDFWGPSRVIPETINEFPYWSFLYADLHAHVIGIPLALLFLGLVYTLISQYTVDWQRAWPQRLALLATFALLLGTLASVNLWELPTYFGLGVLALLVCQVRRTGRIHWLLTFGVAIAYMAGAYLLFLPFFRHYVGVGASGVGLVQAGDALGNWLLIWGLFLLILVSWLFWAASRPLHRDQALPVEPGSGARWPLRWSSAPLGIVYPPGGLDASFDEPPTTITEEQLEAEPQVETPRRSFVIPLAGERWVSQALRFFDRLPRLIYLQRLLVLQPTIGYLLTPVVIVATLLAAALALWTERSVLALCLAPLGLSVILLWRRSREADPATLFVNLLLATGLAILAGTQVIYLKDFLAGGGYYRMNTVFKFFSQIWVLWGVAAAIGFYQLWIGWLADRDSKPAPAGGVLRAVWQGVVALLIVACLAYPIYGTPARLEMRMVGWQPPFGTLNGLEYMREGSYTWRGRDSYNQELPETRIELRYDLPAIQWLLDHVRGNPIIVESSERDYYRAGGTRVASMTGISGLGGMHEGEQRYGELLGPRDALHREFWTTTDPARTQQILEELDVALIYVGQLERYLHPQAVQKLVQMADAGLLTVLYENEQTTIYAVPGQLVETEAGNYLPAAGQ
jgi:uncharacterized membrane protein